MSFEFGRQVVDTIQTNGTFSSSSSRSAYPTLAFLNFDTVSSLRDKSVPTSCCNQPNPPVARLRKKQLSRLQPRYKAQDPYIAAVLIALAQGQRQRQQHADGNPATEVTALTESDARAMRSKAGTFTTAKASQETVFKVCSQCRQDHESALELSEY